MDTWILVFLLCSWKIETLVLKSKVTDYAALIMISQFTNITKHCIIET